MELGILAGVGAIGYLLSQQERDTNFERKNDQELKHYLQQHPKQHALATENQVGTDMSCADSYPLYSPEYVKRQQQAISGLKHQGLPEPNKQGSGFNRAQNLMKREGYQEDFTNFMPANDPTSDNLLDMKERPPADFYHNNMVPFFGAEIKQNMAGTGVSQGNYVDGVDVNSGFDHTTPHQTTLATFTGLDDTYIHKREAGPLFSPAETSTGWVFGQPNFRPDRDRYTQNLNNMRHDLKPVEPQMVGPGLNLDPDIPAQGGFHEFTRILPNNVSDYKANQLPGRVQMGKYFSSELPTSYPGIGVSDKMNPTQTKAPGVVKNRPESFWDQTRRPTMSSKVGFQGNFDYNHADYQADFKPNNALRDQTSFGLGNLTYKQTAETFQNGAKSVAELEPCIDQNINIGQGPLGTRVPVTGQRSPTYMSQDNNIRSISDCNSFPVINGARPDMGQGNIVSNWYVNETDRGTVNPMNLLPVQSNQNATTFWTATDEPNTTRKETLSSIPFAGYISGTEKSGKTFYTYDDEPKTSRRETTQTPFVGNAARGDQGTEFYTYDDILRTTRKETTDVPYVGAASRPGDANMNRMQYTGMEVQVS